MKPYYEEDGVTHLRPMIDDDIIVYDEARTKEGLQAISPARRKAKAIRRRAPQLEGR